MYSFSSFKAYNEIPNQTRGRRANQGSTLPRSTFVRSFAVALESLFFGREYDHRIWISLLPIVAGVALTTATELSFVLAGFLCAMAACFANALQMILTELLLKGKLELDSINTVSFLTCFYFLFCFPFVCGRLLSESLVGLLGALGRASLMHCK